MAFHLRKQALAVSAVLACAGFICSQGFAAEKSYYGHKAPAMTDAAADTAAPSGGRLNAAAIRTVAKMDPKVLSAISKLNGKTLDTVTRLSKNGALTTIAKNPKAMTAMAAMGGKAVAQAPAADTRNMGEY